MKTMKKSMVVTTVLMVLLLIVALSTATFAWYTAQSQVSVTDTLVSSANSTSASLAIDRTNSISSTNSKVTITVSENLTPMVPKIEPKVYKAAAGSDPEVPATTYTAFTADGNFTTQSVDNDAKFNGIGQKATPATIETVANTTDSQSATSFYVINTNRDNATTNEVQAKVTIATEGYTPFVATAENFDANKANLYTKDGTKFTAVATDATFDGSATYYKANVNIAKFLRVAMFVDGAYYATWSGDTTSVATAYGEIENQAVSTSMTTYNASANGASVSIGKIAASTAKKIELVVWFDGVLLGNEDAGAMASFTISFE